MGLQCIVYLVIKSSHFCHKSFICWILTIYFSHFYRIESRKEKKQSILPISLSLSLIVCYFAMSYAYDDRHFTNPRDTKINLYLTARFTAAVTDQTGPNEPGVSSNRTTGNGWTDTRCVSLDLLVCCYRTRHNKTNFVLHGVVATLLNNIFSVFHLGRKSHLMFKTEFES